MNKKTTFVFVFTSWIAFPGMAQTTIDAVRKENETLRRTVKSLQNDTSALRAKLRFNTARSESEKLEIKSISSDYKIEMLSCKGNSTNQTVRVELLISHSLVHQTVCIATKSTFVKAYDELGNEFPIKSSGIGITTEGDAYGVSSVCDKIPTDVPVKAYLVFKNILPSTAKLKFVSIAFKYRAEASNSDYEVSSCELKNINIQW